MKLTQKTILLLLSVFALSSGFFPANMEGPQPTRVPPNVFHTRTFEASTGGAPGSTEQIFYKNGRMTGKLVSYNNRPWEHTLIEYQDELSLYSIQTMVYHGEKISVVQKDLYRTTIMQERPDQKIESWYYHFDKDRANTLRQVDTYWPDTNLVKERQIFDERGGLKAAALFEYDPNAASHEQDEYECIPTLSRMTLLDEENEIVADYRESIDVDLEMLYAGHNLSADEIGRRVGISQDNSRTPILVMDGGIDISHVDLAHKLWRNPGEVSNGRDDDGNGLVDDVYGVSDNAQLGHPVQDLRLPRFGLPAFSHGTLVASIAAQGRDDVAVMAASELTTINSNVILPRVELLIKSHGIRFTNMSFVFDKQLLSWDTSAQRPHQINQLVQNTPQTLHVVAAGNGAPINGKGFNVDRLRQPEDLVPAMLPHENILVVGALKTDRLDLADYPTYELAGFSNVGELSVDILAPGTRMCGAQMGGGTTCEDGTSFAAPYVLNHGVLNVAEANPDLDIYEIKEILMKTAYIPDLDYPYPVRSGGIVHPQRAVAAARWLGNHPSATVEEAALAVRRAEAQPIPGERNDAAYLAELQSFWTLRQVGPASARYARLEGANPTVSAMP